MIAKKQDRVREWAHRTPTDVRLTELLVEMRKSGLDFEPNKSGSHSILRHPAIERFTASEYAVGCGRIEGTDNCLTVPRKGQKVRGRYVRRVARFILFLREQNS